MPAPSSVDVAARQPRAAADADVQSAGPRPTAGAVRLLQVLCAAAFLLTCQSQLFAPLIPALTRDFGLADDRAGTLVPLYMLPYGISSLFYGPLSDRIGRRRVIMALLAAEVSIMFATAAVQTFAQMQALRLASGLCSGGIIPIVLALVGDVIPYRRRGRALGLVFAACAAGSAFGSTFGALLNPSLGWRGELAGLAVANAVVLAVAYRLRHHLPARTEVVAPLSWRRVAAGYVSLVASARGGRAYLFVLCNGMFHYGIYTWLGVYFAERYHLDDRGIGLALGGYGVAGMLLAPSIGRYVDRFGRARLLPFAVSLGALCAAALAVRWPLPIAAGWVALLSLSYDLTYPPLVGIVTGLQPPRRGQAMGLNALMLFTGFGAGAMVFRQAMAYGLSLALLSFALVQLALGLAATRLFRAE